MSKFKPEEFLNMLMFSDSDHSPLSLQDCCNDLLHWRQKNLSKVGLHKRFNSRSVEFLKAVLAEQMSLKLDIGHNGSWRAFSRVLIADSCKFFLPKSCKEEYPGYSNFGVASIMNIQYAYDLKNGCWQNLEFTKVTQNDQGYSNNTLDRVNKEDLHIRDLGFITKTFLKGVIDKGAFFLNRLPPQWVTEDCQTGERINWRQLDQKVNCTNGNHLDTWVRIENGKNSFPCRLIAVPVPERIWMERIRKAQQKAKNHGTSLSEEYKIRQRFSIFITNADEQTLKTTDVVQLYRLRWQIELIFKVWKSLVNIHKIKAIKRERLESQLLGKFISTLLNWKIYKHISSSITHHSATLDCSVWKFFKHIRRHRLSLRKVITGELFFTCWLELCVLPVIPHLLIESRKGKKASYCIINEIFKS